MLVTCAGCYVLASALAPALAPAIAADAPKIAGLSKAEATVIANRFFDTEVGMEAIVAEPTMQGDHWVFPLKVGYANHVAKDPILVNRFTGKASWAGLAEFNRLNGRNKGQSK